MNTTVHSLTTLSLNKVVTEIWWNCGIIEELEKASPKFIHTYEKFLWRCEAYQQQIEQDKIPCYELLEAVLEKIMSPEYIPRKLKTQIAMSLIKLEKDVAEFMLDLLELLKDTSRDDDTLSYCLNKLWITRTGELDRSETLLQILEHSYLQVELDPRVIGLYCCMRPYMLYGVLEHVVMINKKEGEKKLEKIVEHIEGNRILGQWKEEATQHARAGNGEFRPNRIQVFNYMAVNAPLDILKYFCKRLKKIHKPMVLSLALVSVLLSKKETSEKIVFLQSKVANKEWLKILVRHHGSVFRKLILSRYSLYCVKFFRQLCENDQLDISRRTLLKAIHMIYSPDCKYDFKTILRANSQETFLSMWCHAPDCLKKSLGSEFYSSLDRVLDGRDYNFLKILINDSAFSPHQKDDYGEHVASILLLDYYRHDFLKDPSIKDLVVKFQQNMDLDKLKRILTTKTKYVTSYSILFKNNQLCNIKKDLNYDNDDLINDRNFMVQALSVRLVENQMPYSTVQVNEMLQCKANVVNQTPVIVFLKWCFDDNESKIQEFVQQKLLSELWLVDILKKYLLETSKCKVYPTQYLFRIFSVDDEKLTEIKKQVREDTKFIETLLENFMVRNFCNVRALLKCIFMENQYAEKKALLKNYALSESGIRRIHKMLESEYYSEDLYITHGLFNTIEHFIEFIENWIMPYQPLPDQEIIEKLNINDLLKSVRISYRNKKLLVSETIVNIRIVEANHRIFMKMMEDNTVIYRFRLLNYIQEGITESLTDFSVNL